MNNYASVLDFIKTHTLPENILEALQNKEKPGVDAAGVQSGLGIVRNNASTLLNQLHKAGEIIKINSRPVTFIAREHFVRLARNSILPDKTTYSLSELELLAKKSPERKDPFQHILGKDGSLENQVSQAKAAMVYPPKGLHTLVLGASGVGKTTFAAAMHAYGVAARGKKPENYPFVTFNCADYYNNPQLLLSHLFGHTKNAFTGAGGDKAGLVEKADGGVLFLDEVHRLPPEGQEMLFYLMDKGEYKRLGESAATRKADFLIIAATTEDPDKSLLTTFKRRIPITINLPQYSQKPVFERIMIIGHFFSQEAMHLNQPLRVDPEVLKSLAIYDFKEGNIGQLCSEIKKLCANAFLQYLQDNRDIHVHFALLKKEIRDCLFRFDQLDSETKNYLATFSECLAINPVNGAKVSDRELSDNIYRQMSDKLVDLKNQGLKRTAINEVLKKDVDEYFNTILKHIRDNRPNIKALYQVLPKEVVDITSECLETAQHQLSAQFDDNFLFGLCFHVQALLNRTNTNPVMPEMQISKIKKEHAKEYFVAQEIIKKLEAGFHTSIPAYEQSFLALLLAQSQLGDAAKNLIGAIIICHGDSTASSIASVANTLLNTSWLKAIDMPLSAASDEIYAKFRSAAVSVHQGKGIFLLVDMGSLVSFGERLTSETGIEAKVVSYISTPLVIEVLRKVLYRKDDINTIYDSIQKIDLPAIANKKPAILSICMTGKGASQMMRDILEKLLYPQYQHFFDIVVANHLDVKSDYAKMQAKNNFIAAVGNIDPKLDIPFFPIGQIMQAEGQKRFFEMLNANFPAPPPGPILPPGENTYDKACHILEEYVKCLNPKIAVTYIKNFIENIRYNPTSSDDLLNMIVHLGCMLDRCVQKEAVYFENIRPFKEENAAVFQSIRAETALLEEAYGIKINDDEVCYIIQIIYAQTPAR